MNKILIIDDDDQMRLFMETALKETGAQIHTASDGDAGVKTFQQTAPQLVICDLFMPQKEGLETIKDIRRLNPHTKIIAISGGSRLTPSSFLPIAKRMGADKTLAKPFGKNTLLQAVNELLPLEPKTAPTQ
jgi:two-component system, chemotaxis family, chemotaxis protein CheY